MAIATLPYWLVIGAMPITVMCLVALAITNAGLVHWYPTYGFLIHLRWLRP